MTKDEFWDRYPHLYECTAYEIFEEVVDPLQDKIGRLEEIIEGYKDEAREAASWRVEHEARIAELEADIVRYKEAVRIGDGEIDALEETLSVVTAQRDIAEMRYSALAEAAKLARDAERAALAPAQGPTNEGWRDTLRWIAENDPEGMFGQRASLALLTRKL